MKRFKKSICIVIAAVFIVCCLFVLIEAKRAYCDDNGKGETVLKAIVNYIKNKNARLNEEKMMDIARTVYEESDQQDVDYRLILAIIKVESNFRCRVTSKGGSWGLMQIKPRLARAIAKERSIRLNGPKDLHEPDKNIKLGVYHISRLKDDFGDVNKALHAYSAGVTKAKKRFARDDDKPDTLYIKRVLKEYRNTRAVLPDPPP